MIKILFICHGSILKNFRKVNKINIFAQQKDIYNITTVPFFKEP